VTDTQAHPGVEVAIIGAGPGGIAAAVKVAAAGIDDFLIVERADDFGGSWHENHYPGLSVDIPAIAYQYSFARNPNWSRVFPRGAEVKRYHVEVAKRFDLYRRVRFNTDVVCEQWDDAAAMWVLHTRAGEFITARFLISAVGAFIRPKADPGIPGWQAFEGKLQRPAAWDHDYELGGKRVAVIGTGASAVQIIPAIAPKVEALTVFQRTPVWALPKPDYRISKSLQRMLAVRGVQPALHGVALGIVDLVLRAVSGLPQPVIRPALAGFDQTTIAAYRRYLKRVVSNPNIVAALAPNFGVAAKRPTLSNHYLQTYNRPNVELVTIPISEITTHGIRTRDGREHCVDVIVLATGYEVFSDPETYRPGTILGRDEFDLADYYRQHGLQAYQSVAVPGLPNRWTLVGPYSWTGSGWHAFVEMTADHAVRAISEARRRRAARVEVRQAVHNTYHDMIVRRSRALRYYFNDLNGHVPTYYRNSHGDSTYVRPTGFFSASRANRTFSFDDYHYEQARDGASLPVQRWAR
jgi:cation diffusion facilitator CzcD-associated flavoprotein CzcO